MGRPSLPLEKRATRRVTVRLYVSDTELLDQLCTKLEEREGEVIRQALRELARKHRITAE